MEKKFIPYQSIMRNRHKSPNIMEPYKDAKSSKTMNTLLCSASKKPKGATFDNNLYISDATVGAVVP